MLGCWLSLRGGAGTERCWQYSASWSSYQLRGSGHLLKGHSTEHLWFVCMKLLFHTLYLHAYMPIKSSQ